MRVCAPAREEMIATLFKAVFSCFLARLSMRRDFLGEVLHRNAPCCLLNRPSLRNKAPLFRKKTPTFFEKSPTFLRKSPSFFQSSPTYWTTLLLKGREQSWISEVQIRCVEARKHFMIDIFRISSSSAQQYSLGAKKIPLIAGWMGYFYRSAQCWLPHQGRN